MKNTTVSSIEKYLDFLDPLVDTEAANVPKTRRKSRGEFTSAVESAEDWRFVQAADHHYFIARVLYLNFIIEYSLFAAYQCVENYLKAYIKAMGESPPPTHALDSLLEICRRWSSDQDDFVNGRHIEIILKKVAPFYEKARYPVCLTDTDGGYAWIVPDDIYILDYFVYRMRERLDIPENTWDILKNGHFCLDQCQRNSPDFYNRFFENNINFTHNG